MSLESLPTELFGIVIGYLRKDRDTLAMLSLVSMEINLLLNKVFNLYIEQSAYWRGYYGSALPNIPVPDTISHFVEYFIYRDLAIDHISEYRLSLGRDHGDYDGVYQASKTRIVGTLYLDEDYPILRNDDVQLRDYGCSSIDGWQLCKSCKIKVVGRQRFVLDRDLPVELFFGKKTWDFIKLKIEKFTIKLKLRNRPDLSGTFEEEMINSLQNFQPLPSYELPLDFQNEVYESTRKKYLDSLRRNP